MLNYDINTYSVFHSNDINKLTKDQTYIDCNSPIEISHDEFSNLLKDDKIYELTGYFDANSLAIIINGVKRSSVVEQRIKNLL